MYGLTLTRRRSGRSSGRKGSFRLLSHATAFRPTVRVREDSFREFHWSKTLANDCSMTNEQIIPGRRVRKLQRIPMYHATGRHASSGEKPLRVKTPLARTEAALRWGEQGEGKGAAGMREMARGSMGRARERKRERFCFLDRYRGKIVHVVDVDIEGVECYICSYERILTSWTLFISELFQRLFFTGVITKG